jgi:hypothetical protein
MRQQAIIRIMVLTAIFAGTVAAQEQTAVIMPTQAQAGQPGALPPHPSLSFDHEMLAVEPVDIGEPVERAPYSAVLVDDMTQELPDGNRVERTTTGAVARDSHGRVRRELAPSEPAVPERDLRLITISDPVAGVHYVLDPVRKIAMRSRPPRIVNAQVDGPLGAPVLHKSAGPEIGLEVLAEPEPGNVRTEQLGTKEYEGVRAEGTRTIRTVPAGTIGNLRPIEIVSERWYSPELRVVVYSRRTDPRFGETIYRLTNITRAEPDAALFQVPPDYKQEGGI